MKRNTLRQFHLCDDRPSPAPAAAHLLSAITAQAPHQRNNADPQGALTAAVADHSTQRTHTHTTSLSTQSQLGLSVSPLGYLIYKTFDHTTRLIRLNF